MFEEKIAKIVKKEEKTRKKLKENKKEIRELKNENKKINENIIILQKQVACLTNAIKAKDTEIQKLKIEIKNQTTQNRNNRLVSG